MTDHEMTNTLDYAPPDSKTTQRRRVGWIAFAISVLLSLGTGLSSIKLAIDLQNPVIGYGPGQRNPYWMIDKLANQICSPIIFLIAGIGCAICWRRRTGRWLSLMAWVLGIGCWVAAVCSFP